MCDQRGNTCPPAERLTKQTAATALAAPRLPKRPSDRAVCGQQGPMLSASRLGKATPRGERHPLADTLGRIFHIKADDAATGQQVATRHCGGLLIAFSLIVWEHWSRRQHSVMFPRWPQLRHQPAMSSPLRPAMWASSATGASTAAPGDTTIVELHEPYSRWCAEQGCRALPREEFAASSQRSADFVHQETLGEWAARSAWTRVVSVA